MFLNDEQVYMQYRLEIRLACVNVVREVAVLPDRERWRGSSVHRVCHQVCGPGTGTLQQAAQALK